MAVASTVEANIVATFQDGFSAPAARALEQFRQTVQTALGGFAPFNLAQDLEAQLAGVAAGINAVVPELAASLAALSGLGAEVTLAAIDDISPAVDRAVEALAQVDQREAVTLLTVSDQASQEALRIRAGLETLFSRPIVQIIEARGTGFTADSPLVRTARNPVTRFSSAGQGSPQTLTPASGVVVREPRPAAFTADASRAGNITFNIQGGFLPDRQTARRFARMMDDERRRIEQRKGA